MNHFYFLSHRQMTYKNNVFKHTYQSLLNVVVHKEANSFFEMVGIASLVLGNVKLY